jgi:hypothetical protein
MINDCEAYLCFGRRSRFGGPKLWCSIGGFDASRKKPAVGQFPLFSLVPEREPSETRAANADIRRCADRTMQPKTDGLRTAWLGGLGAGMAASHIRRGF